MNNNNIILNHQTHKFGTIFVPNREGRRTDRQTPAPHGGKETTENEWAGEPKWAEPQEYENWHPHAKNMDTTMREIQIYAEKYQK